MLTLCVGPQDCISLASHIALEEVGADYKVQRIDFKAGEQRGADYFKINPKGRVPALITDHGILTETPGILVYIGQTHPQAKLIPSDPFALAKLQELAAYLCSTVHPNLSHYYRGSRWSDDPVIIEGLKVKAPQNVRDNFAIIQKDYFKGPWVMGHDFSLADIYLYTISTWLPDVHASITEFPGLLPWFEKMKARPAVQRVEDFYA